MLPLELGPVHERDVLPLRPRVPGLRPGPQGGRRTRPAAPRNQPAPGKRSASGKRATPADVPSVPSGPVLNHPLPAAQVGTQQARPPSGPSSTVNPQRLSELASPHTSPVLLHKVISNLVDGADLGYTGPSIATFRPNNRSALSRPSAVTAAIHTELTRGHTVGPFPSPPFSPFRCNPLGARDKPDNTVRLILDLSQPQGLSVNDHINRDDFTLQYITLDDAIAALFTAGPHHALMAKADLKHAFRLIPVKQTQWWLLGFCWDGSFYHDVRLPFGLRSACAIFNDLAEVLRQALAYHSANKLVYHYLDDFFFFSAHDSPLCADSYRKFLEICSLCNIPLSSDKCHPPDTRMALLGCILDTNTLTISLPPQKVQGIIDALESVRRARKVRQRDLLSLIGKLVHATKCIPAGRSFFRRLLDTAHSVKRPHHRVTLNAETKRDLDWWLTFLPTWNGVAPMLHPTWTPPSDLSLATDASLLGYGGTCRGEWFSEAWPQQTLNWCNSMTWLELIPILVACAVWGPAWRGLRVTFHCDNSGVVGACAKGWSRDPRLMSVLRQMWFLSATHGFTFRVVHVRGHDNATADALSRLQLDRFRALLPEARPAPAVVPEPIKAFLTNPAEECTAASGFVV